MARKVQNRVETSDVEDSGVIVEDISWLLKAPNCSKERRSMPGLVCYHGLSSDTVRREDRCDAVHTQAV